MAAQRPNPGPPNQGPPSDSFILPASDGAELLLRAWIPAGPVRQILVTAIDPTGPHDGDTIAEACSSVGVATFALLRGVGPRATGGGWLGRRFRRGTRRDDSELVSWLRMLYPGVPVWVIGNEGQASLVAASPADAARLVRRAVAAV